jgi:hypothetical protein
MSPLKSLCCAAQSLCCSARFAGQQGVIKVKLVSTKGNQSVVHAEALFGQIGVLCLELESQLKKKEKESPP